LPNSQNIDKLSIALVKVDRLFGVLLALSPPPSEPKNCRYGRSHLLVPERNKNSKLQIRMSSTFCLLSSIAPQSRTLSDQLVSPPPTVLASSEIQLSGCFPHSLPRAGRSKKQAISRLRFPEKKPREAGTCSRDAVLAVNYQLLNGVAFFKFPKQNKSQLSQKKLTFEIIRSTKRSTRHTQSECGNGTTLPFLETIPKPSLKY